MGAVAEHPSTLWEETRKGRGEKERKEAPDGEARAKGAFGR